MQKSKSIAARIAATAMALAMTAASLPSVSALNANSANTVTAAAAPYALANNELTGEGTEQNPFKIGSLDDLITARNHMKNRDKYNNELSYAKAYYKLTQDIEFNQSACDSSGGNIIWSGFGKEGDIFTGVFDGNGHTISNFYSKADGRSYYIGLFARNSGTIKNLIMKDPEIEWSWWCAALCDTNYGTIENCAVIGGSCKGTIYAGAICNANHGGTIKNCFAYNTELSASYHGNIFCINDSKKVDGSEEVIRPKVENCYYYSNDTEKVVNYAADGDTFICEQLTDEDFKNGKAAWLLGSSKSGSPWVQNINSDDTPKLDLTDTDNHVYQVQFMLNGKVVKEAYMNKGLITDPPKVDEVDQDGYTTGQAWYKEDGGNTPFDIKTEQITGDTILYSQPVEAEYTITLELNGGSLSDGDKADWKDNKKTYTIKSDDFTLPHPTKQGYEFIGWTSAEDETQVGNAQFDMTISTGSIGNRTYHAQYKDTQHPTASIKLTEADGSDIDNANWDYLAEDPQFDLFFNDAKKVEITANDNHDSQVSKIYYYFSQTALDESQLKNVNWNPYDEPFEIKPTKEHTDYSVIVYVKAEDSQGNAGYASTSGITIDVTSPQIIGVTDSETYCKDPVVTISDLRLAEVKDNGEVILSEEEKAKAIEESEEAAIAAPQPEKRTYIITDSGEHNITVSDKAGNTASVSINVIGEHKNTIRIEDGNYTKNPTCDTAGERRVHTVCRTCGKYVDEQLIEIPAKGHTFGEWKEVESAGCETAGHKERECSVCKFVETQGIDPTKHSASERIVTKEATCTQEGSYEVKCTKCDAVIESGTIPVTEHEPADAITVTTQEATCTDEGLKTITIKCKNCGAFLSSEQETIPAKGHDYDEWEVTDPQDSCTDEGALKRKCKVCSFEETKDIVPGEHDWEEDFREDMPADCANAGSKSIHCRKCGETKNSTVIPALGHKYGEWEEKKASDCQSHGIQQRECSVCGDIQTKDLEIGNHNFVEKRREPTCTEAGETFKECSKCGATIDSESIPATGHTFGDWKTTVSPTCTAAGSEKMSCEKCGYEETRSVPAAGHSYKSTVVEPTETEKGYTEWICTVCGDTYYSDYTDPTAPTDPDDPVKPDDPTKPDEPDKPDVPVIPTVGKAETTTFTAVTDAVRINWKEVEGADGYRVYRFDPETGKWKSIKTLGKGTVTTYRNSGLQAGINYSYKVKAFVRYNGEVYWGSASDEFITATDPVNVTFTKTTKTNNAIRVNWKSVDCSGYKLQMYNKQSKKWQTVKLISHSKTTYRISGLDKNTSYRFRIQAFTRADGEKSFSRWSDSVKVTTKK